MADRTQAMKRNHPQEALLPVATIQRVKFTEEDALPMEQEITL